MVVIRTMNLVGPVTTLTQAKVTARSRQFPFIEDRPPGVTELGTQTGDLAVWGGGSLGRGFPALLCTTKYM